MGPWQVLLSPDLSGPEDNGKKAVFHTLQISRTGASPSDPVKYHTQVTPYSGKGGALSVSKGYSQHFLSPADKAFHFWVELKFEMQLQW